MGYQLFKLCLDDGGHSNPNIGNRVPYRWQLEIKVIEVWFVWSGIERLFGNDAELGKIDPEPDLRLKRSDVWIKPDEPWHKPCVPLKSVCENGRHVFERETGEEPSQQTDRVLRQEPAHRRYRSHGRPAGDGGPSTGSTLQQ